jgi:hypothetical protein
VIACSFASDLCTGTGIREITKAVQTELVAFQKSLETRTDVYRSFYSQVRANDPQVGKSVRIQLKWMQDEVNRLNQRFQEFLSGFDSNSISETPASSDILKNLPTTNREDSSYRLAPEDLSGTPYANKANYIEFRRLVDHLVLQQNRAP